METTILESIIGTRYGLWEIISEPYINNKGRKVVDCRCTCAKQTLRTVNYYSLTSGRSTSCNCSNQIKPDVKIGQVFERLIVIGEPFRKKMSNGREIWHIHCQCTCENKTTLDVRWTSLRNGETKSCSCRRIELFKSQLSNGKPKSNYTIIEFNGETKSLTHISREYGIKPCVLRARIASGWDLEKALNKESYNDAINYGAEILGSYDMIRYINSKVQSMKVEDSKNNQQSNINLKFIIELLYKQQQLCIYSNNNFIFQKNTPQSISIDRIDSNLHHIQSNVQLVQMWINYGKRDLSDSDFRELLDEHLGFIKCNQDHKIVIPNTDKLQSINAAIKIQKSMENWIKTSIGRTRCVDKKYNRPNDITLEYVLSILEKQEGLDKISKQPLLYQLYNPRSASIDRIDSSKGHIKGNIQIVQSWINKAKNNFRQDKFIEVYYQFITNNKFPLSF